MPFVDGVYTPVHVFQQEYAQGQRKIRADYMDENFDDLANVLTDYLNTINKKVQDADKSASNASAAAKTEADKAVAPVATRVTTAEGKITTLESTTKAHGTEISTLKTTTSSQGTKITNLETTTSNLTTKITALETTTATHTTKITALETTTATHTTDISSIKTKNTEQDTKIETLEKTTANHTTSISTLETSVSTLNTNLTNGLNGCVKTTGAQNIGGVKTFNDNPISKTYFGKPSALSGTAIAVSDGTCFTKTVSANTTFTVSGTTSGTVVCFCLVLTNGGNYTVTWPSSFKWSEGSAPDLTKSGVDVLTFMSPNGGTTWYGTLSVAEGK